MQGKAFQEVNEILNQLPLKTARKIPVSFLKMVEENADPTHEFHYDPSKSLEEQNVSDEAKVILSILYIKCFADENEKKKLGALAMQAVGNSHAEGSEELEQCMSRLFAADKAEKDEE